MSGNNRRSKRRERPGGSAVRRPVSSYQDPTQRLVYVAAEGAKTEGDYITLLNRAYGAGKKFHLHFCRHSHPNGLRPVEVVKRVIAEADRPDDEKWALFDRDSGDKTPEDIRDAMSLAAEHGVHVALSHPSFELWLLLHFKQHTSAENGRSATVLDRLRAHPDANGFADYAKQSGDRGKGLGPRRAGALLGREKTAITNARALVGLCPHPPGGCSAKHLTEIASIPGPRSETKETYEEWNRRTGHGATCDPVQRDPSADVWRLLVSLGIGTDET
ncbi:RloB family protein [Streptomyces sp. NPDC057298]|uniref:RloB family protein n=1 Tax=Streptomyces sp. NPDC057298 TaxID=3346091 RepID=UPI003634CCE0